MFYVSLILLGGVPLCVTPMLSLGSDQAMSAMKKDKGVIALCIDDLGAESLAEVRNALLSESDFKFSRKRFILFSRIVSFSRL